MSHKIFCYRLLYVSLTFIAIFAVALLPSNSAQAQVTPPPPPITSACDPQYMGALKARAWMEAQREIAQNQNLIFKPDSVLAMTCFGDMIRQPAINTHYTQSNRPFSETTRWGSIPGFDAQSTDQAIAQIVLESLELYLGANFPEDFLDWRAGMTYTATPATTISATKYSCDFMGQIWHQARCMEFIDKTEDGFFDFSWYQSHDPRDRNSFDSRYSCPINTNTSLDGRTAFTAFAEAREEAFNQNQDMFTVVDGVVTDGVFYLEDPIISHLDNILPGTNCSGSAIVMTGVSVQRPDINGGNPYDEFICVRPGCSANPNAISPGPSPPGTPPPALCIP